MLKIKDNVDLKELEKFGLTTNGITYSIYFDNYGIEVNNKTRQLKLYADDNYDYFQYDMEIDTTILYDLITNNLVEKI
jgi:hypothetical protein